jgi:excisionase family DNA binding protein
MRKLLRVSEVASILDVGTPTIYKMVKAGILPKARSLGAVRIPEEAVDALIPKAESKGDGKAA